jgi:hypothetical protein
VKQSSLLPPILRPESGTVAVSRKRPTKPAGTIRLGGKIKPYLPYIAGVSVSAAILGAVVFVAAGLPSAGLKETADRLDLVSKVITTLALLAGGIWALFTFVLFRSAEQSLLLAIEPRSITYHDDLRVVLFNISLRNAGKVVIKAGSGGCRVWINELPQTTIVGASVDLDAGEQLVDGLDLLAHYDKSFAYEIEPGSEYHEFGNVVVAVGSLLSVRATFYFGSVDGDDAITEYRLVHVD